MEAKEKVILPEKYYHTYFNHLLTFIKVKSGHLLSSEDDGFITEYGSLSEDAQCLFIRFSNRKGPYFRLDKINYNEIDIEKAFPELLAHKFISEVTSLEPGIINLFLKQELLDAFPNYDKGIRKSELVDLICSERNTNSLLEQFQVIKVEKQDDLEYLKMLYFGHYRGQMTEFVIRDIGNIKLESLDESKMKPWFSSREEAISLFQISKISSLLSSALKVLSASQIAQNLISIDFSSFADFSKSQKVMDRAFLKLGQQLEREDEPELALKFYEYVIKPPSRERQVRIYDQMGQVDEAVQIAEEIKKDYRNATEYIFAKDFLNRPKIRINRSMTERISHAEVLELSGPGVDRVEQQVLSHFAEKGYNGVHSENFLWCNLFGLFFWEELFDQSYDNFHNPIQRASSDLFDHNFFSKRKESLFQKQRKYSSKKKFLEKILSTHNQKFGINNPLIYWHEDFEQFAIALVKALPVKAIISVLIEMAKNLKDNKTGFPDLFIWDDKTYYFYEVKSPNDHLSAQQLFWIDFMETCKINVNILRVKYLN